MAGVAGMGQRPYPQAVAKPIALVLVAVLLAVCGELLLKHGMNRVGFLELSPSTVLPGLVRAFTSPFVLAGFGLVFGASILWLSVLSQADLSWAYPLLSLGYLLVVVSSWMFLGESVSLARLAGVLVIVLGVIVVAQS